MIVASEAFRFQNLFDSPLERLSSHRRKQGAMFVFEEVIVLL